MTARADRRNLYPALGASAVLHACILAAGLVAWPWARKIVPVDVTPVTLMTSAELARLTAAQQADKPAPQTTPTQDFDAAQAPPPAPEPAPTPTPPPPAPPQPKPAAMPAPEPTPKPSPAAKPVPKPAPEKPPPKATATPTAKIDLDKLAASLATSTKQTGPTGKSAAPKGPARPEQDLADRIQTGQARAASTTALSQIADKVTKLWNPNCGLEATANVHIRVRMNLNADGSLAGPPKLVDYASVDAIKDPVIKASATRATTAVSRGAPYDNLPRDDYSFWKTTVLNFDAKSACGG